MADISENLRRVYDNTSNITPIVFDWKDNIIDILILVLVPLSILFIMLLIYNKREWLIKKYRHIFNIHNVVWILFINTDSNLKFKPIKLDRFDNFMVDKKKYTLQDMKDFVIGEYKGSPLFIYDNNFILPLKINKQTLHEAIEIGYKKELSEGRFSIETEKIKLINAITLMIKPSVLKMVYEIKLLDDLYKAGKNTVLDKNIIMIISGIIIFVFAYYSGILSNLIEYFGL